MGEHFPGALYPLPVRVRGMTAPLCPRCGGVGIVDTSPPGVDRAPWLQTDTDCPDCAGTGLRPPLTMLDDWQALGEAVNRLTEATREALEDEARRVTRFLARVRERLTR